MILLFLALLISSGKTRFVFAALSLTAFASLFLKERRKKQMLGVFLVLFLGLSLFYNMQYLDRVNPMTKVRTQTIYQEDDYANQYYPDHFLRLLLKEYTVKTPYEIKNVEEYMTPKWEEQGGEFFNAKYYKETNYVRFMCAYAKECLTDADLPGMQETDPLVDLFSDFSFIGKANDMLRYVFLLNEDGVQESAYFWYSWYYYSFFVGEEAEESFNIYIRLENLEEDDTIVALWDSMQNLYLMTESYYENEVKAHE